MLFPVIGRRSRFYLGAIAATALAHVGVVALCRSPALPSNALQLLSSILAVGLCLHHARLADDAYFRGVWIQLGIAFAIWTGAQGFFYSALLRTGNVPKFPSAADFLWLLFAFPMLLVTITKRSKGKLEWVNWLDAAQAAIFFGVLSALVFSHPATLSVTFAYEIQGVALVLACALRYSSSAPGPERILFRNVGGYLIVYGVLSSVGNRMQVNGLPTSAWVDLCWSLPSLLFCTLILLTGHQSLLEPRRHKNLDVGLPRHLHGLIALGLSVMSISAAVALQSRHRVGGLVVLLLAAMLFVIRTSARESQLHTAHLTLQHSTFHDTLTGLPNRAHLLSELDLCLSGASPPAGTVGVLFIDLDRFKAINDSLGHPFGDRLLIRIASLLRSAVRPGDMVVRLGGDEFVVFMNSTDKVTAQKLAAALIKMFREPIALEGRLLYLTASVGVVLGEPGMRPDDLLRDADCAMYEAKKRGKDQEQTFEHGMVEKAGDALSLETDLRHAIDAGDLTTHYQAIYSLSEDTIVGFEALARWQHDIRGMVWPAAFIPVAEETGLIIKLGAKVLRDACREIKKWNETSSRTLSISVNVSARQFADPELLHNIIDALAETRLAPNLLKLEITESVLLSGIHTVETVLNAARHLGIEISLDDFGTGYSSLSYLLRLPFDVVKIDRSFVQALVTDSRSAELVRTIVQLARNLDKKVIAEGVETGEQRDRLGEMGCDLMQGYLFSKPIPSDLVAPLLELYRPLAETQDDASRRAVSAAPAPRIIPITAFGGRRNHRSNKAAVFISPSLNAGKPGL